MKIRFWIMSFILLCLSNAVQAARVDTLMVHSESMDKKIKVVCIRPDKAVVGEKCPVLYLLHGYGNNATSWINIKPELPQIADRDGIIFICPDGSDSWYFDCPKDPKYRYETFVAKELVDFVDKTFATKAKRSARAITGLSMGGHGGMRLAIRHKDTFGGGGSMSGGLDIRSFPENWNLKKLLGEKSLNESVWEQSTAIGEIDRLKNGELAVIIDCGYDDFFLEVNQAFHKKMQERGVDHDFILRPGGHNHKYWNNAIDYQILFFKKFFER